MLYVKETEGVYICYYCDGMIYEGTKAIMAESEYKDVNGTKVKVTKCWHPECFLKDNFNGKSGEEIFKGLVVVLLPLIVDPEEVKDLIIAFSL